MCFFFQAEDGIRDTSVTGVQTCALPISSLAKTGEVFGPEAATVNAAADEMASKFGIVKRTFLDGAAGIGLMGQAAGLTRSEERRVGRERRAGGSLRRTRQAGGRAQCGPS